MLDCIILGHKDTNFQQLLNHAEKMKEYSGLYVELKNSTIPFHGQRYTHRELFNYFFKQATGKDIYPCDPKMSAATISYLMSFLQKKNFSVDFISSYTIEKSRLINLLKQNPLTVVITSTYYVDYEPIIEIVKLIRKYSTKTKIIIGGPYILRITLLDMEKQNFIFKNIAADFYINDAQGEATLSKLIQTLKEKEHDNLINIPNLIYTSDFSTHSTLKKNNGNNSKDRAKAFKFIRTKRIIENNDLNDNGIDWNAIPKSIYFPTAMLKTSRGCAFQCSYCNFRSFAGSLKHPKIELIQKELALLHEKGVRHIAFLDDTFNVPKEKFKKILNIMIDNKYSFKWISYLRCEELDDETITLMKKSGCQAVFLGIESGDQKILNIMNKASTVEKNLSGIKKLNTCNILSYASFIIGHPGETRASVQNTIDFIDMAKPTFVRIVPYFHMKNTPIHKNAKQFELKGISYSWRHNTMDWKEACKLSELAYSKLRHSISFPLSGFMFWGIPDMLAKGISLEHIVKFGKITQKLHFNNYSSKELVNDDDIYKELLSLFKEISTTINMNLVSDWSNL